MKGDKVLAITETLKGSGTNRYQSYGWRCAFSCVCLLFFCGLLQPAIMGQWGVRRGLVVDESGAPVAGAKLTLQTTQGSVLQEMSTTQEGAFAISELPVGSYVLGVAAENFQAQQMSLPILDVAPFHSSQLKIVLSPKHLRDEVTITANRGAAVEVEDAAHVVSVRDQTDFQQRPLPTIGHALEGSPGVTVQQTTYHQVSPFLRGLTGYHVLNLIDGIRFNNSTFRSGPNQYLAFVEPSQVQRVEALLGPTSSQYGSDSLGGTIHLLTLEPRFSDGKDLDFHGDMQAFASTADMSGGAAVRFSLASQRVAWSLGGTRRHHNDLRAGGGTDSHHVFHRFFGLSGDQIKNLYGNRQQDTGFTQYGWHTKLAGRLAAE